MSFKIKNSAVVVFVVNLKEEVGHQLWRPKMKKFLTGATSDCWPGKIAPTSLQPGEGCLHSGWNESSEIMCLFVEHLALLDCRPNI